MGVKICKKCEFEKPLTDFSKNKKSKDGYFTYCKLCKKELDTDYYLKNKRKVCSKVKEYRDSNKQSISINKKNFNSSVEGRIYYREYFKKYYNENPHLEAWRTVLKSSLRRLNTSKQDKTIDLLEYTALELKNHISSLFTEGMSWKNHGEWHIDHIKPVSSFDKETSISVVNALSNLRPLWATTREINGIIYQGNLNRK